MENWYLIKSDPNIKYGKITPYYPEITDEAKEKLRKRNERIPEPETGKYKNSGQLNREPTSENKKDSPDCDKPWSCTKVFLENPKKQNKINPTENPTGGMETNKTPKPKRASGINFEDHEKMAALIHQFRFGTSEKDLGRKYGIICNLPGVLKV